MRNTLESMGGLLTVGVAALSLACGDTSSAVFETDTSSRTETGPLDTESDSTSDAEPTSDPDDDTTSDSEEPSRGTDPGTPGTESPDSSAGDSASDTGAPSETDVGTGASGTDPGGTDPSSTDPWTDSGTDTGTDDTDPATAPRAPIDRFSVQAGTLFVRDGDNGLPAPNAPVDFDASQFVTRGISPEAMPISYYNFDVMPRAPASIYVFFREGELEPLARQLPVVDAIPGSERYNDIKQVVRVQVPEAYAPNTIRSVAAISASGYPLEVTDTLVNYPIVPEGSVARLRSGGAESRPGAGWYENQVVSFFRFEESRLLPGSDGRIPISYLYAAYEPNPERLEDLRGAVPVTEPGSSQTHNVVSPIPGEMGYSPLREMDVYDNRAFDKVSSLASATQAPILLPGAAVVNCPVVSVNVDVEPALIIARSQTLSRVSTQVFVETVSSPGPGWVVVYSDADGIPGEVIGHQAVIPGAHADLPVTLDRPAVDGETLFAALHTDDTVIGIYEFPDRDGPVLDGSGAPIMQAFSVSVPAGTPAIRVTVTNIGTSDYEFVHCEPFAYADTVGAGADPQVVLYAGWRYELINLAHEAHPFELIGSVGAPADDTIAFSQSADGVLEESPDADWHDDGEMIIRVTVTPEFVSTINGYRCETHPATMRGQIRYR